MPSETLKEQLGVLSSLILDKPPYCFGTLTLPPEDFILFYGRGKEACRLGLVNASDDDLRHLAESCDVTTFGLQPQGAPGGPHGRAGGFDKTSFAVQFDIAETGLFDVLKMELLEGKGDHSIRAERCKLDVHALILRHEGKQWAIDWAANMDGGQPKLVYVAFGRGVEREALAIETGYRVTLTYILYFSAQETPSPHAASIETISDIESDLEVKLQELLEDPEFLPDGGVLGFGLRNAYPLGKQGIFEAYEVEGHLKGTDAALFRVCERLDLFPSIQQLFPDTSDEDTRNNIMILCDRDVNLEHDNIESHLWRGSTSVGERI